MAKCPYCPAPTALNSRNYPMKTCAADNCRARFLLERRLRQQTNRRIAHQGDSPLIKCEVCGLPVEFINPGHLSTHEMTVAQ